MQTKFRNTTHTTLLGSFGRKKTHGELYNFPKASVLGCRYISSLFSCSSSKLLYLYNIITEVKFCFISIMNIAAAVSYSIMLLNWLCSALINMNGLQVFVMLSLADILSLALPPGTSNKLYYPVPLS